MNAAAPNKMATRTVPGSHGLHQDRHLRAHPYGGVAERRAFGSLVRDLGWAVPAGFTASPGVSVAVAGGGTVPGAFNLPAAATVLLVTALLVIGIRESATTNTILVVIKSVVLVVFVAVGIAYVRRDNLTPLVPPNTGDTA